MATGIGTWLGIGLSLAGFAVTFWQVWAARREAQGAREAVLRVERRLASNSALLLLPQLLALEQSFVATMASGDTLALQRILVAWRHAAGEAVGLLRQTDPPLAESLASALYDVSALEPELQKRRRPPHALKAELGAILASASAETSEFLGRSRAYTDEGSP